MHGYSIDATAKQWGVGQGGFFTQAITFSKQGRDELVLRFVYDCGTKSTFDELRHAVESYVRGLPHGSHVEAVYVSHLDEDHVNGLSFLAAELKKKDVSVRRVVIPPLSNLHALALVTSREGTTTWEEFVFNPADRLREWFSDELRVLSATEPNQSNEDDDEDVGFSDSPSDADTYIRTTETSNGGISVVVGGGSDKGRLPEATLWEVVPFVQPAVIDDEDGLYQLIARSMDIPLSWHIATGLFLLTPQDRETIRDKIQHWKGGDVNYASLVLYSGSARRTDNYSLRYGVRRLAEDVFESEPTNRTGWLGTGDAKFSDSKKDAEGLHSLRLFYGSRLKRLAVVNAPHHGSVASSGVQFWKLTEPNVAVFNASGKHHGHPRGEVLRIALQHASVSLQTGDERSTFTFSLLRE